MHIELGQLSDQGGLSTAPERGHQRFEFTFTPGMQDSCRPKGRRYRRAIRSNGKQSNKSTKDGAVRERNMDSPVPLKSWDELPLEIVSIIVAKVKAGGLTRGDALKNMRLVNSHWRGAVGFSVTEMYRDLWEPQTPDVLKRLNDAFPNITSIQSHRADAGVEHLYMLPKLTSLSLWGTRICDKQVRRMLKLTSLRSLNLGCTKTGPGGLKVIAQLINLTDLDICDIEIVPDDLACLSSLCKLKTLVLAFSNWTKIDYERAGAHLGLLPQLESLDVGYSNASARQLKALLPKCSIRVKGCVL